MAEFEGQNWKKFKTLLPQHRYPYSKKNWGNKNHSLCSYQGKLKPSIAHFLVKAFVPEGGSMFDPFAGVGTIPFEAALNDRKAYGMDISQMAYYVSSAKLGRSNINESREYIKQLSEYIKVNTVSEEEFAKYSDFGLNKKLVDYYEPKTFREILLARKFFQLYKPVTPSEMVVLASLLHILHGNRPYALSRRSHPIVPYAPSGNFVYKNLVEKLQEKVGRFFTEAMPRNFVEGKMFLQDSTKTWPDEINNLDSIITSPPFFASTRFYVSNWIRLWFSGWEPSDFNIKPKSFVDERQKATLNVYYPIFAQGRERLKKSGTFVLHLGKSKKCDMGIELRRLSRRWFPHSELFVESVEQCAKFGIKDLGTVTDHEYLVLW